MKAVPDILQHIVDYKDQEVASAQQKISMQALEQNCVDMSAPRDFVGAIKNRLAAQQSAVIAEIKKASPSQGVIRPDFDVEAIARSYAEAQAACLSVLTDEKFFHGHPDYIQQVKAVVELPVLRKDFMISPYQIFEARALGADCILLIVAVLNDHDLQLLHDLAHDLGMAVLIECHDADEVTRARHLESPLLGINNRNLRNFSVSLQTSIDLANELPADKIIISESGIHTREDIKFLREHNIHSFLIGECCMRADDPGTALEELIG